MSMYTQLLEAAFGQRPAPAAGATEQSALEEVLRCRRELEEGDPPDTDPHAVPVALALQIAYDVALLDLAGAVGHRHRPEPLRATPAGAGAHRTGSSKSSGTAWNWSPMPRSPSPSAPDVALAQVPVASVRDSWAERSLSRAANVAAWVLRSIPSFASRFDT